MKKRLFRNKAFTLIELLIVIAVIALLAVTIFVVVDPGRRIADAKETVRKLDTVAIETAIDKAIAEATMIPTALRNLSDNIPYMLVTDGGDDSGTCNCATLDTPITRVDIAGAFKDYLGSEVPVDSEATGDDTGYYISKAGNHFSVRSCNAYGDTFVQADPETITCYFDQYDIGGEEWPLTPADMVDNPALETAGQTYTPAGDVQLLTHSTCANQTFGTITQVRVRHQGYCMFSDCGTILRPVFSGTLDGDNNFVDDTMGGWNAWVDITHNTNAPATWTTSDVVNLDLDVESASVGAGTLWTVFQVQLEVTHIPS